MWSNWQSCILAAYKEDFSDLIVECLFNIKNLWVMLPTSISNPSLYRKLQLPIVTYRSPKTTPIQYYTWYRGIGVWDALGPHDIQMSNQNNEIIIWNVNRLQRISLWLSSTQTMSYVSAVRYISSHMHETRLASQALVVRAWVNSDIFILWNTGS